MKTQLFLGAGGLAGFIPIGDKGGGVQGGGKATRKLREKKQMPGKGVLFESTCISMCMYPPEQISNTVTVFKEILIL